MFMVNTDSCYSTYIIKINVIRKSIKNNFKNSVDCEKIVEPLRVIETSFRKTILMSQLLTVLKEILLFSQTVNKRTNQKPQKRILFLFRYFLNNSASLITTFFNY